MKSIGSRLLFLTALFGAQILAVTLLSDSHGDWHFAPRYVGELSRLFTFCSIAALITLGPRLPAHWKNLVTAATGHPWTGALLAQICAYSGTVLLTCVLFENASRLDSSRWAVGAAWICLIGLTGLLWLRSMAPAAYWLDLIRREKLALGLAIIFAILTRGAQYGVMQSWMSLSAATLNLSGALLGIFYHDVLTDIAALRLGTPSFNVRIAPACSGYEGIGLVVAFLSCYVWAFRKELRFPRVLILFPLAIGVSWILNVFRIVALIAIGSSLSPAIALRGFHSAAGWTAFILVAVGVVCVAHGGAFAKTAPPARSGLTLDAESAMLIPLLVLLASTLLSSAFSSSFEWLYPVRVIATGLALAYCWKALKLRPYSPTAVPIAIGSVAFIIWLMLVPASPQKSSEFAASLSGVAPLAAGSWLVMRWIGAVLTVPLAEELAFRGYLIAALSGKGFEPEAQVPFRWLSFAVSSVMFGFLHGAWLAGTAAGMCFAWARYHRGEIGDAVVAHMTTNLLLSVYVLSTGQWSYW